MNEQLGRSVLIVIIIIILCFISVYKKITKKSEIDYRCKSDFLVLYDFKHFHTLQT